MQRYYFTDVRSLSDEELETLSAEIAGAFDVDAEWCQDTQEVEHYWEMQQELRRRWHVTHPGAKPVTAGLLAQMALKSLTGSLSVCRDVSRAFDREF